MRRTALLVPVVALVFLSPIPAAENAWVHSRGPSGQGYSDDTRVPLTWSEKENVALEDEASRPRQFVARRVG